MSHSIYQHIHTLVKNKMAFVDVDETLTAYPWETTEKDLLSANLTNNAVKTLQNNGYMCTLITSRTAEMCMSNKQYILSQKNYGFIRPQPHVGINTQNKHFYIKPEEYFPSRILDLPIIISSSGAQISVLQKDGGYAIDHDFYPPDYPNASTWRKETMQYLSSLHVPFTYARIDSEDAYNKHETDIFPADYRIQLLFKSKEDMMLLQHIKKRADLFIINDSNPDKKIYTTYLAPKKGKTEAINHVLNHLRTLTKILVIGDSLPDFEAGIQIYPISDVSITLLLVGGSRLTTFLLEKEKNDFAGTDLTNFKKNMTSLKRAGYYLYTDHKTTNKRLIIIGDVASPQSIGPKCIVEILQDKRYHVSSTTLTY